MPREYFCTERCCHNYNLVTTRRIQDSSKAARLFGGAWCVCCGSSMQKANMDYQAIPRKKGTGGLIAWAAIGFRALGDFDSAAWLDEQQHQLDVGNYSVCADMLRRMYPAFNGQLA